MSLFAKLITLTALQTQDADGTDELVVSRRGGVIFERISLSKEDEFAFDDDRLLPFDDQVEVVLTEVDAESQQHQDLGSVTITAGEHNLETHAAIPGGRSPLRSPIQGHRVTNLSGPDGGSFGTGRGAERVTGCAARSALGPHVGAALRNEF